MKLKLTIKKDFQSQWKIKGYYGFIEYSGQQYGIISHLSFNNRTRYFLPRMEKTYEGI